MSPGLVTHPASVTKPCPAPAAFLATEDPENSPLVRLPRIPPDHPSLEGPVLCWDEPWGGPSSHTAACPPHTMGAAGRASGGHNEEVAGRVRRVPPRSGSAHGAGSGATATGRGTGGPHTPVTVPGAFSACHCSGPADRPACPGAGGRRRGDSRGGFQPPSPPPPSAFGNRGGWTSARQAGDTAAVLEGNDADPPCCPERMRAHGPGSCGARVVSPAGADPRSGTALSRPQSRPPAPELGPHFLSCLLGFPIFVLTPALLTTPCSGCAFACGRVSVCARAHSCSTCVQVLCVYVHVHVMYVSGRVSVCAYIRVTCVHVVWLAHMCAHVTCVCAHVQCSLTQSRSPRLPLTRVVPRGKLRLEERRRMACVGRPPLGCRTPVGRAALQLLGG